VTVVTLYLRADYKHTLALHPSGGYYSLGSPLPHQQLFVLSLTLENPGNLPESVDGSGTFYYCYNLLDNYITSELFKVTDFKTEKASIRVMSTRERLGELFASQEDMKVCLCQGSTTLGEGSLSLKPLSTQDFLGCRIELKSSPGPASYVDVRVELEKEIPTSPFEINNTEITQQREAERNGEEFDGCSFSPTHPASKSGSFTEQLSHHSSCGSGSRLSVKRSLTQSFEDVADQNSDSKHRLLPKGANEDAESSTTTSMRECLVAHSSPQPSEECKPHPKPVTAVTTIPHGQPLKECVPTFSDLQKTQHSTTISNIPLPSFSSPVSLLPLSQLSYESGSKIVTATSVFTLPQGCAATSLSSSNIAPICHPTVHPATTEPCGGSTIAEDAIHQYQYSIDIHSIHNIQLGEGLKCFVKYNYPYFGSSAPVVVQPSTPLVVGAELHFAASYSAFKFASSRSKLVQQLHLQPLPLQVWASAEQGDNLLGVARIPLGEVFTTERVISSGNITHQKCSLKVPVMATLSSHVVCAYIHCTLTLEDHGPIQLSKETGDSRPFCIQAPATSLPSSSEYLAAMELEMWKLSQEETFANKMKAKEAEYLHRLGEEWKKREEERQKVFTQKVSSYNNLEKQLISALRAAQHQQKGVLTRESEVHQLQHKLMLERQTLQSSYDAQLQQCQVLYEGKVAAERAKVDDLSDMVERLKKQVSDLSSKLASRDTEFDAYRRQVLSKPESKLQAELTMIHMEKSELERKLSSVLKSKQHYKEQWSRTLKELAAFRQKEQTTAREVLQRQQQELETMRARHMHNEEQRSICQQLNEVKDEVSRLQKDVNIQGTQFQSMPTSACTNSEWTVNPDVARWIEERDILLQTGVYTHNDVTIQKLDQKNKGSLELLIILQCIWDNLYYSKQL
jgi:hypothetical protein